MFGDAWGGMAVLDTCIYVLAVAAFIYWLFQWPVFLNAILYARWKYSRKLAANPESLESLPGVSILKPLTGVDPNLYSNLESFFNLSYPTYEIQFCVEDDSDPAVMVVKSLQLKYPNVSTNLFIGAKNIGVNPKINNMMEGYEQASYELVMISDSGLRMKEDTLTDMMSTLKEDVGLVHQMPFVCDKEGFAGVLEKTYFGTYQAKMYLLADFYGVNCVTGMSCVFRKSVVEEAQGLKGLSSYLTEDYYLAQTFKKKGWKLRISNQPAWQNAGNTTVANFQARMRRWIKLRSALVPVTSFLEPFSECMLCGVMISFSIPVLFDWSGLAFFFVHTLLWFIMDYLLLKSIQNGPIPFSKFEFLCGWLFRECCSIFMIIKGHMDPVITWRSRKFLIKSGAIGEEIRAQSYV